MNPNSENAGVVPALRKHMETMRTEDKDSGHQPKEQEQSKRKSSTSGKNVCEYCDRRFNEYSNLIKHRRIHTGLKPYKCEFCNKAFTQSSNLNVHRKRCQLSCKKQPQCFANPAQRSNNTNFKKKIIRNNFQKSHDVLSLRPKENINALVFDTTQELVQNGNDSSSSEHLDISNSDICRELQYKSCWQKTSSNNNFKTKFAEGSLKYGKLNVLGSQKGSVISAPARSLYQHPNKINSSFRNTQGIRLAGSSFQQTKRRAYFCEFCSRRFNESSNLIKHRRIHTGQRPYKCNFCGKDFTQSSNLNVHKKICKGDYFAKTAALHFVPSTKSATLSSSGVQNEFKKASRYLSSRIGALEKSSLPSQLPHQNNLPICSWNDMKSSRDILDTSSVNSPISQLQNTELPFSTTDNQILPHKYIFYSSQPQNINDEYAENNTEEQCSNAQADLINPLEIKLDVTQNSDDWVQLKEKCLDPGSVNLFRCQHCDETFLDSSFLQSHVLQVHTGKTYFGPTSESPTLTNQQACTNGKSYTCELCHKKFTRISILNFHRKTCAKNFSSHNSHISLVDYEEDHNIKNLDFNSANPEELDYQTASTETRLSLDKCSSLINNPKNINYIVIDDDDDDDDDDEGLKPDNDLNTRETMKQENSVFLAEDLKPALVKEEPDDFPVSMETYGNLSLSEVDSKSFLSHVEPEAPTLGVWEIKQEPLENQDPSSPDALGVVKQEIFDENYDWNSIDIQPSMSGPEVMHDIFEAGIAPTLETRFRSEELETKNLDFLTDNQHLLLDNYESDFIQEAQNHCSSNSFENISSKRHLNSQYFIRKSSNKLQCHFPSCNGRIFKSVSAFQVHVRVHNGQKPYMCEICNKTFNERSNFTKHLRIHSGSKPYKCTQCGRDFTQSSNLNVHKRKCRGLGSVKTPMGSVSSIMLEAKSSPTNRINFEEFSEVSHNSMNAIRSSANSSQSLAASVQSNVYSLCIPEEYDPTSSVPKQTCITEKNDYEESIESNSSVVSEPSQNFGKGTLYTCEFCDKGFIESSDLIKHKTCHSVSKSYKCSFCHKVFTLLKNYNLHKATCKRKLSLNGTCHNVANPEMKNLEFLSDNSNSLLPTSSERSRKMPDTNASLELDNQIRSSSYFSQRNEFSILPTSAVLQGQQNNEQSSVKKFSHSLPSFDSNAAEEKIVTGISDENSNRDFKSVNPSDEDLGLNQQQSVEEIRHNLFEVQTNTDSFENQTKIQTPLSDSSDQNSISIKDQNKPNSLQTKTAPKPTLNPEKFFQCKLHYCRKIFHLATDLMEHAKQHKRRGVHVCKFCNKQFNESSNLVKHRRIHTGSKPYKCEFCNRFFTQSSNRNVHRKNCWKSTARHSASSGVFNSMKAQTEAKSNFVQCEVCLQRFKHITDLESHKNSCKFDNRNRIENPGLNKQINSNLLRKTKASKFQSGVKSSKNVENSNKELNCFQNTVSLGSLPQENTTNSLKTIPLQKNALHGRYMFQCPERECGKIFETTSMLRNHINDHKETQQYPCEFCSKTFSSFENLSKHCETHTGYKSYRCSLCGKVFAQSSDYFIHCKTCNTSILPNPARLDPRTKLTEKSLSASAPSIKGIVENSYYKAQLQQTETTNQVINIDDDDDELVIIEPGESVLNSNISSQVDEHPGNKSGEMVSPKDLHLNDHLSNNELIGIERVMLKNSPDNIRDGDLSSNELGAESSPSKNLGQLSRKEDSSNYDEDLITSKDTSVSLIEISSQSGYKSNSVINSSLFCNRLKTDTTSSQLRINLPNKSDNNNNDNNNPKPQMETHFDNIRKLNKNLNSRSLNLFSCKVRLCQKVFKSEQELKAHQCKRRTYPCEYCQKRFNESSNLIKHRRIHTGHKPYRCKFCGKTFTQSSNLNVHNKICGKKHNFVECRFSQCLKRNIENTDAVCGKRRSPSGNGYYLKLNPNEDKVSSNAESQITETNSGNPGENLEQVNRSRSGNGYYLKLNPTEDKASSNAESQITETNNGNPGENLEQINRIKRVVSNEESISIRMPSVNSLFIENSSPITKLDDRTSVGQKTGQLQDSGIIVENSLTGEVELQLSEKELSAYKINETLPVKTSTDDDLLELRNSKDEYSVNLIPSILKKETYQLDPNEISIFPSNTGNSQTLDPLQLASNNFYNSKQPTRPSSSRLDLVTNKATQIVHRFSRHKRTMKTGVQLKKLSLTHLKRPSYTCEFCKRRFNESSNLIKHRRIHTGLRPYKCQLCGKTFTQSSNRNVHKKICAKKHQLSNGLVERSHVSMSVNQQINWTNFQKNKTLKYQKTGYLQTSETQSYRKPDSALNIDQNQVKNLGSNDNQPDSFVNDTEPICSISSVRSLRENPVGHFPFLDSETKYFDKNRTNDFNHSLIASDSRNSLLPETTLCSNNQSLHSVGNVDRLSTDLSESSNFDPVFQLVNYNKPINTTNETTPSNLNHNFNSISLSQDQNEFPRKYFQCFFCPRLCRNSADFQRHMRVHTGHKPYKCKICNKLFTDHSNFSKHCRVHTGYKPYKCNLCYRAFSQSSNLNVHKKNCKGFHLNSSLNLSFQSKTTNSLNKPRKLNSQVPQIVLPSNSEEVRNLTVPSSKAHSSTSKLIPGTTVSELKSHPRLSMNKLAHSKSVAQRISLKYLNKITSRSNKTFFRNSEPSSKPKILHQVLNETTPVLQNTNSTSPETINITSSSNKLSSHLIQNNSYLKKKNYIGLLDKNHNNDHPKAIADRTSICNYKNQNKIHYQTKSKKYGDLHQIRKYYYCEYCSRRFNEASNLTKHRRIHTGLKPYKCQHCSKHFTQSSNLNVHKKICKAIVKNSEILINPDKGLWSKSSCMSESDSFPRVNSESQTFAEPTKDENPKQIVRSTEVKKFAGIENISKEEEDQNNSVNLSLEMSNITNASEISINYPASIYKNTNIGNEIEDSTPNQAESQPKPSNNEKKLSQSSFVGVSNFKSIISSPKHIKNDLGQEKSIQLKLLEDPNYNYIIKDKPQLSPDNPSRVKKTRHDLNLKSDNTNKNCLLVDIESINKHLDHQNTDGQKETFLINSASDQNNTNDNDLEVQLATEFDSSNKDDNNMIRQPSQIPLSLHNYNSQKSETDSKTNQSNISQSLINYNENLDKSIKSNDLSNLLVVTEEKNREHSNSYAMDVLDSGTSNAQLKLSQSQNQVQVLLTDELKFENEPDLKNDVFSYQSSEIELEHLHPQQSDILKNIQSAINGILQTENISSSVDQLDESLLQNAASDWFKVEPCYPKNELVVLNNIDPSSKNVDSKSQEVNSCGSNEEEEDDIIIDSSTNVQPVKSKLMFEEETIPKEIKSSYQTISEENPLSDFDCSITVQSKSIDRLSESHNNGKTAVSPLTNSYSKTKHILDYQNNELSERNYEISDQPQLKHNNQTEFLQVNCSKQQLNSNNFIDEDDVNDEDDDDDDVAIIDIKSTVPLGAQSNLNMTSTESPYDPAYFSNNIKVSSTVFKSNMDVFLEDPITKQTDNRLDHIRESFDYLVPSITDQLDSENDCKVVEASKTDNASPPSRDGVYVCEFCQERFLNSSLLVGHHCPNTGDKPYLCPDCGKAFSLYANVIAHKSTCLKLSVEIADFSALNKNDSRPMNNCEMEPETSSINQRPWGGEYHFSSEIHSKTLLSGNPDNTGVGQNSEPLSGSSKKIQNGYEAKTNVQRSKYENSLNRLSEFPSSNLEITLDNYDCRSRDDYNDFNSSVPCNSQAAPSDKSEFFLGDSFANNHNTVTEIRNTLPTAESLPSDNINSSLPLSSSISVSLDKLSSTRPLPDNLNFQIHPNKHPLFPGSELSYMHNNYRPQSCVSSNLYPNVLLKDLTATDLSSNQTSEYSLRSPTAFLSSPVHSNTSIPTSISSASSTSFNNVLDPAVSVRSVSCQYCDKVFGLSELDSHKCSGVAQANRYACTFCEKTLCDASSLSKHLRIHTGHKPYSCDFCGKAFTQSSNLNVHKRVCKDRDNQHGAYLNSSI